MELSEFEHRLIVINCQNSFLRHKHFTFSSWPHPSYKERSGYRSAPRTDLRRASKSGALSLARKTGKARDNRSEFSRLDRFRHMHLKAGRQRANAINRP